MSVRVRAEETAANSGVFVCDTRAKMKTSVFNPGFIVAVGWYLAGALLSGSLTAQQSKPSAHGPAPVSNGLTIRTEGTLPATYPHAVYQVYLEAQGESVPPLHWKVGSGGLPPGMLLEDTGLLHGEPTQAGEYHFAISVTDSGKPQQAVQKEFVLKVVAAMTLVWKTPAHVAGNRIEGSVEVSNTTAEDIDLTFVALAVAENGRATAIGYQHFTLQPATTGLKIAFGETLPHGGYVVHVDAVGEVAKRNVIYRQRLQTPSALQVMVGP